MTTTALCALRGGTETRVVRALALATAVEVTRRCADLSELLAAAAAGLGRVAVVSADLPGLDREAVHHLHGSGVRVVAVSEPRAGWPGERVRSLGVDAVVELDGLETTVAAAVLASGAGAAAGGPSAAGAEGPGGAPVDVVTSAAQDGEGPADVPAGPEPRAARGSEARGGTGLGADAPGREVAGALQDPGPGSEAVPGPDRAPTPRGRLVAVWGPTGAPGRTTIALGLACELAEAGALLVDADTYGGTVAQMLGLMDEAPGVAAAARAAATGRLDVHTLAALTPVLAGGLRVLTGISRADRWPEVPASSLEVVWDVARELAPWTVVDCGFNLEQDETLSYDTRAPRRNAATLSALAAADVVVVVGGGDPIGMQRLVRGLAEVAEVVRPGHARRVVVNRVRASASGPRPQQAIRDALRRYAGVSAVHLVPEDRPALDGAVLAARTLREHAPGSPARRAVAALAVDLVGGQDDRDA